MNYTNPDIAKVADVLMARVQELENKSDILKAAELKALYDQIREMPADERKVFGQEVNQLRQALQSIIDDSQAEAEALPPIDVTAPL